MLLTDHVSIAGKDIGFAFISSSALTCPDPQLKNNLSYVKTVFIERWQNGTYCGVRSTL